MSKLVQIRARRFQLRTTVAILHDREVVVPLSSLDPCLCSDAWELCRLPESRRGQLGEVWLGGRRPAVREGALKHRLGLK